ncbi:hypothetical protein V6N13_053278 [Hibiscus sabdariffa]
MKGGLVGSQGSEVGVGFSWGGSVCRSRCWNHRRGWTERLVPPSRASLPFVIVCHRLYRRAGVLETLVVVGGVSQAGLFGVVGPLLSPIGAYVTL